MPTTDSIFRRNRTLIFFILGLIIVFCLLYALRSAIFPFLLGIVLVYLVKPLISWVEKKLPYKGKLLKTKRISLIIFFFIVFLGLVGLLFFYLVTAVADSFSVLIINAPEYISEGLYALQEWVESLRYQFSPEIQQQVDDYINNIGSTLGNAVQDSFMKGLSFIPTTISFVLAFISLPIFLFYILKDSKKLSEDFYSFLSPGVAVHTRRIISIMDNVLGQYIRAQLLLGFIVACLVFIGLTVLGIEFAPALAVFAGLTELIPILGPWIGGAAGVIVALALAPQKAIWVALVYLIVQQLENIFLVPRIQGGYLHINPAILIVLLVLGSYIAGLWGIILIAPLTATVVEIYKYVRESFRDKEIEQALSSTS